MPLAQLTVLVTALLGWSDITIQPNRGDRSSPFHRSVAGIDRPSERTVETLRRYDLEREYRRDVNSALLRIEKFAQRRAEAELVYALAELSWIEGKRLDRLTPRVEARLPDGSRLTAAIPPVSSNGYTICSIRRFRLAAGTMQELVDLEFLSQEAAECLGACVRAG